MFCASKLFSGNISNCRMPHAYPWIEPSGLYHTWGSSECQSGAHNFTGAKGNLRIKQLSGKNSEQFQSSVNIFQRYLIWRHLFRTGSWEWIPSKYKASWVTRLISYFSSWHKTQGWADLSSWPPALLSPNSYSPKFKKYSHCLIH